MSQLQTNQQIVRVAESFAMGVQQDLPQFGQSTPRFSGGQELIGIGAALGANGKRLPSPNQLRPAQSEIAPPSPHVFSRHARFRPVPPLHRLDGEAVADNDVANTVRLGKRRLRGGKNAVVTGQLHSQLLGMGQQVGALFEAGDAPKTDGISQFCGAAATEPRRREYPRPIPTRIRQRLITCAAVRIPATGGLMRTNSTANRALPERIR